MLTAIDEAARAERIWLKVQRKPASVVMTRPKVVTKTSTTPESVLAAQTVRIASDNRPRPIEGVAGSAPVRHAIVYGVVGHPDPAVTDTDMAEGYTFTHEGDRYRCVDVIAVPGGVQGTFVVNG
jgi:hypothetical protein